MLGPLWANEESMKTKLLPCPFCSGKARLYSEDNESGAEKFHVGCTKCSAALGYRPNTGAEDYAADHKFLSAADAAEAWNARGPTLQIRGARAK